MEKAFEELQIKDDFMFGVIMRNPRFCRPFLERFTLLCVTQSRLRGGRNFPLWRMKSIKKEF